jgi:GDSL-like lipase/acylhydrolase family protein
MFRSIAILAFIALGSVSVRADTPQPADLSRLVVVGDSLAAGYQNFSLFDGTAAPVNGGQQHGFANLVAAQASVDLHLPLISYPGIPPALQISAGGVITRAASVGSRTNPGVQTFDLSVPGFLLADALGRVVDPLNTTNPIDAMALSVLAEPGTCGVTPVPNGTLVLSEVGCAVQLRPTTVLVSIGNNDALQGLIFGVAPTDSITFTAEYAALLSTLSSTGAAIVVGNIPDVTDLPFLVPASAFTAQCGFSPVGAGPNDYVVPAILNPTATSFNICANYQPRSAALVAQTTRAVSTFNSIIKQEAKQYGAEVVDVNKLFSTIAKKGYDVNGVHLTAGFLGGIFSLDGIHPTNTGYAILANAYIDEMNKHMKTNLAPVDVGQIAAQDPLIFGAGSAGGSRAGQ